MLKPIKIGNLTTKNNLFLCPLCGITDAPFREMIADFGGVGMMYTEMIPSRSIHHKDYLTVLNLFLFHYHYCHH